ncbi:MAG: multicopper oxidase domain-containing protein, partial [Nitrospirales bacterium]
MEEAVKGRDFSRRDFLMTSGQAGVGALLLSLGGCVLAPGESRETENRDGSGRREINLEAREIMWELAPGKRIKAMAYNGQIPGPELRLKEGERVRIVLKNALSEPTTIHWHGLDVPNPMDGVPGVTQKPVQPGETFIYEFEAKPAGTRWYHTH